MAVGTIAPFPKHQFFDNNGNPAAGYKLFSYQAGTTTKQNTYNGSGLNVANANPVVLDSAGRCPLFLDPLLIYKFVLATPTDTDPPASPLWTADGIYPTQASVLNIDVSGVAGTGPIAAGTVVYAAHAYTGLTAGRWYICDAGLQDSALAPLVGIAQNSTTNVGDAITVRVQGRATGVTAQAGVWNYAGLSGSLAGLGDIGGTGGQVRAVGYGDSATSIILPASPYVATPRIFGSVASAGNSGSSETDLASIPIGYGQVTIPGDTIVIDMCGTLASNTNLKTIRLDLAGVKTTMFTSNTNVANNRWTMMLRCAYIDAANIRVSGRITCDGATGAAGTTTQRVDLVTGLNLGQSTGWTLKVTGQATADNDITKLYHMFEIKTRNF